jgi:hypothetical protein
MTSADPPAGSTDAALPDLLVVLHPSRSLVLDAMLDVTDAPSWSELLDRARSIVPDGALPLGPRRQTDAAHVSVAIATGSRTVDGTGWVSAAPRSWPQPVRDAVRTLLAEDAGTAPTSLRPRWMRRGWWPEATAWVDEVLKAVGSGRRTGPLEAVKHWSISSVARVPITTPDGRPTVVWLKAIPAHFHREAAVLPFLGAALRDLTGAGPDGVRLPGVPPVLGARQDGADGALLLLADVGDIPDDVAPDDPVRLAAGLARLQAATAPQLERLRVIGELDDRSPVALADGLARLIDDGPEFDRLDPGERANLVAALPQWRDRLLALADGPLPTVLLHGDFHPWNVARVPGWSDGDEVIIDWTDAAVGVAGADLVTLLRPDVAPLGRTVVVDSYSRVWSQALGVSIATCRSAVDAAIAAGYVVQALAYEGILRTVDPASRWQNGGALAENLRALIATEPG